MTDISYDGRVFAPAGREAGLPPSGSGARGHFSQVGDLVRSEIAGGSVRHGAMVGVRLADGGIDAAYCMALDGGELVAGTCRYEPELLPDGRLRFTEYWQRVDGSEGVSFIEEVPAEPATMEPTRRKGHGDERPR